MFGQHPYRIFVAVTAALAIASTPLRAETPPDQPVFVRTMTVSNDNAAMTRQFFGRITPRDTADLSFEVGGRILSLDVLEGTRLAEGTEIARLDLTPFDRAVTRAELNLNKAERDLTRANELAQRNVASEVGAQDAETARDLAEIALIDAQEARKDAILTAPYDSLVAERIGSPFTNIAPGTPIVRLHDMSEVRVAFDLPERLLAIVNDPAQVNFTAVLPGKTDPTPLQFREIEVETGPVGQSYTVSLALPDGTNGKLIPGQTVIVRATVTTQQDGWTIPPTAVTTQPDGTHMVVVVSETADQLIARHQPVNLISETGSYLITRDLDAGTEIVAIGAHLIEDGTPLARYAGLTVEGE